MFKKIFRVALKSRNFKAIVLIRKMSITKLAKIEKGDSMPLNHCLAICQLQNFRTCHLSTSRVLKVVKHMGVSLTLVFLDSQLIREILNLF